MATGLPDLHTQSLFWRQTWKLVAAAAAPARQGLHQQQKPLSTVALRPPLRSCTATATQLHSCTAEPSTSQLRKCPLDG